MHYFVKKTGLKGMSQKIQNIIPNVLQINYNLQSLCLTLYSTSGTLIVFFFISFPTVGFLMCPYIRLTEFHLLHVLSNHDILPWRKQSFQLEHEMLWEPVFIWKFHLWNKLQLAEIYIFFTTKENGKRDQE